MLGETAKEQVKERGFVEIVDQGGILEVFHVRRIEGMRLLRWWRWSVWVKILKAPGLVVLGEPNILGDLGGKRGGVRGAELRA